MEEVRKVTKVTKLLTLKFQKPGIAAREKKCDYY